MILNSYFPSSLSQAAAASKPFINDVLKVDGVNPTQRSVFQNINEGLTSINDFVRVNLVLQVGSRLVPPSPSALKKCYSCV